MLQDHYTDKSVRFGKNENDLYKLEVEEGSGTGI